LSRSKTKDHPPVNFSMALNDFKPCPIDLGIQDDIHENTQDDTQDDTQYDTEDKTQDDTQDDIQFRIKFNTGDFDKDFR